MANLAPRRIPNVVLGTTLLWGGVLSAFFWTDGGFNFYVLLPWAGCIVIGGALAHSSSVEYRATILKRLKYREDAGLPVEDRTAFLNTRFGIVSTLGEAPFTSTPLAKLTHYDFEDLENHAPKELSDDKLMAKVYGRFLSETYRKNFEAYVGLFDAIMETLLHEDQLDVPAGIDRHGGRSLLTHTLLVAALMIERAAKYKYHPYNVEPINHNYKLDPLDPLILILGVSHDLGKVRGLKYNEDGDAIGLVHGHTCLSAREITRFPQYWDARILAQDRQIIQRALAYSGQVSNTPVQKLKEGRPPVVTSDRLHALMGLMGECDRLASAIENGFPYEFHVGAVLPQAGAHAAINVPTGATFDLLEAFANFVLNNCPINDTSKNPGAGMVFKFQDAAYGDGRNLLVFNAHPFCSAFSDYLGPNSPAAGVANNDSSQLTKELLQALDASSKLHKPMIGGKTLASDLNLYKAMFFDAIQKGKPPSQYGFPEAFVVDIEDWAGFGKFKAVASFAGRLSLTGKYGSRGVGPKAKVKSSLSPNDAGLNTGKAKAEPSQQTIKSLIQNALANKSLPIRQRNEKTIAIVGQDAFFAKIGLDLANHSKTPEELAAIGIQQISLSNKEPGMHVVKLDAKTFE